MNAPTPRWAFATSVALAVLLAGCAVAPTEATITPVRPAIEPPPETTPPAPVAAKAGATSEALEKAVNDGRLFDAVRTFSALTHPSADDEYLVGLALMDLHLFEEAGPHLEVGKTSRWSRDSWRPSSESMLDRVAEMRLLAPPALDPPLDPAVEVHAGPPNEWSAPILRAVPEMAAVGRRIFGADLPRVRLFLIPDVPTFDRFFLLLFGYQKRAWQDGTGAANVAMLTTRVTGDPEKVAVALHELMHAWCATYLMDRYGRVWPSPASRAHPWLDEGLAEFVISLYWPTYLERGSAWLKANAKSVPAPAFTDLAFHDSFGRLQCGYAVAGALVAELVGPADAAPAKIRAILDAIGKSPMKSGDVEGSIAAATGKDVRKALAEVVGRFW